MTDEPTRHIPDDSEEKSRFHPRPLIGNTFLSYEVQGLFVSRHLGQDGTPKVVLSVTFVGTEDGPDVQFAIDLKMAEELRVALIDLLRPDP